MACCYRDTLCCYWVSDPPDYCVASGRHTTYQFGDEPVLQAVVLFPSAPDEAASVPLEHLTEVAHCPGLFELVEAGAIAQWERGYEDGMNKVKDDEGIMW